MSANPYSKFFWSDHRADPGLRICSLAARGLWVEMLAIMHEARPYGHLLVSGRAPTDAQLAGLVAAPLEQIPELIAELSTNGVFARTKEGIIYSRRMVRDHKKAQNAKKIGKKGGNPQLINTRNKRQNSAQVNPPVKGGVNLRSQSPKARVQTLELPSSGSKDPTEGRLSAPFHKDYGQHSLDRLLFERGKAILGAKSGGQIAKLKQAQGLGKALELLEIAAQKQNPAEYVAGILRNESGKDDQYEFRKYRPQDSAPGLQQRTAEALGRPLPEDGTK